MISDNNLISLQSKTSIHALTLQEMAAVPIHPRRHLYAAAIVRRPSDTSPSLHAKFASARRVRRPCGSEDRDVFIKVDVLRLVLDEAFHGFGTNAAC